MSNNNSNSQSNSKSSTGANGGGFWDKNGSSIMSAAGTALNAGYQGTKYIAKTGYKAGKHHYNNSKERRENGGNKVDPNETEESSLYLPAQSLKDPTTFAPPPLRPGQKQYQSGGTIVEATDTPIVIHNSTPPTPNNAFSPLNPSVSQGPGPGDSNLQPIYNKEGEVIGYIPMQQLTNSQNAPTISPVPSRAPGRPPMGLPKTSLPITQRPPAQIPPRTVNSETSLNINNNINSSTGTVNMQPHSVSTRGPVPLPPSRPSSGVKVSYDQESVKSGMNNQQNPGQTPVFEVKPYEFIDPETRAEQKRIEMKTVDISKFAPPPTHSKRDAVQGPKLSELIEDKQKGRISHTPSGSSLNTTGNSFDKNKKIITPTSSNPALNNVSTGNSLNSNSSKLNSAGSQISGKYNYDISSSLPAPPKPPGRSQDGSESAQRRDQVNSTKEHVPPPPPYSTNIPNEPLSTNLENITNNDIRAPPQTNKNGQPTSYYRTAKTGFGNSKNQQPEVKADILKAGYDYNKTSVFAPPPKPYRSATDIEKEGSQKHRVTSNKYEKMANEIVTRNTSTRLQSNTQIGSTNHQTYGFTTQKNPANLTPQQSVNPTQPIVQNIITPMKEQATPESIVDAVSQLKVTKTKTTPPVVKPKSVSLKSASSSVPQKPAKPDFLSTQPAGNIAKPSSPLNSDDYSQLAKNKTKKKTPPPKPKKKPGLYENDRNISNENAATPSDNPFSRYSQGTVPTEVDHFHQ